MISGRIVLLTTYPHYKKVKGKYATASLIFPSTNNYMAGFHPY
jgi:hypothetical protein